MPRPTVKEASQAEDLNRYYSLIASLLSCAVCAAQTDSVSVQKIDEVQVTAAYRSMQRSLVPLYQVTAADFHRLNAVDMTSVLRRLPGVTLRDYGGAGGMKTVSVRGLGSTHTGVSLDGLLLSDVQSGQVNLQQFQLQEISAVGLQPTGTSDIFQPARNLSKASLLSISTADTVGSKVSLESGSWGLVSPSARFAVRGRRLSVSLQGGYTYADNDYPFVVDNGVATHTEHRNNSRMKQGYINLATLWRIKDETTLKAMVRLDDNDRQLPGIVRLYTNENDETLRDRGAVVQTQLLSRLASRWWMKAALRWNWTDQDYHNGIPSGGIRTERYIQREYYATASLLFRPVDNIDASYSADFWNNTLTTTLASNPKPHRNSFMQSLSARWQCGILVLQGQMLHSAIDRENRLSPSFSASLRLTDGFRLRASAKEIFRMPTVTEMYYYHFGSQNLKPETTRQLNIGAMCQSSHAFRAKSGLDISASLDLYINKVLQKIVAIPFNMFVWRFMNLEKVNGKGLDFLGNVAWHVHPRHSLLFTANYSLQSIENCPVNKDFDNLQIAYTPVHSGSGSVAWENRWVNVSSTVTFASETWTTNEHNRGTRIGGYMEWGTSLYRTVRLCKPKVRAESGNLNVAFTVQNILNKHYCIVAHYPMPGRNWKISLTYNI